MSANTNINETGEIILSKRTDTVERYDVEMNAYSIHMIKTTIFPKDEGQKPATSLAKMNVLVKMAEELVDQIQQAYWDKKNADLRDKADEGLQYCLVTAEKSLEAMSRHLGRIKACLRAAEDEETV